MGGRSVSFGRAVAPENSQVEESLGADDEEAEHNADATPAFSSAAGTTMMTDRGALLTATHQTMGANDEVLLLLNDTNSDDHAKSHTRRRPATKRPKWRHSFHTSSSPGLTRTLDEPSLGETLLDASDRFSTDLPFAPSEVFPVQLDNGGGTRSLPGVIDEDAASTWSKENISDGRNGNAFRRGLHNATRNKGNHFARMRYTALLLVIAAAFFSLRVLNSRKTLSSGESGFNAWFPSLSALRRSEQLSEEGRLKSTLAEVDLIVFNWRASCGELQEGLRTLRSASTRLRVESVQSALSRSLAAMEARENDLFRLREKWELLSRRPDFRLPSGTDREALSEFFESAGEAIRTFNAAASRAVSLHLSQKQKILKLQLPDLAAPSSAASTVDSAYFFLSPFLLPKIEAYLTCLDEVASLARRFHLKTQVPETLRLPQEPRFRRWIQEERRPKESVSKSDGVQLQRRASFDAETHQRRQHQIRKKQNTRPLRRSQSAE